MNSSSIIIVEYAKTTKNVCLCITISALLIMLFILSPLNSFMISSIFGKIIILTLLGYTVYYNITKTNHFADNYDINMSFNEWNPIKINIVCSYIFSGFLIVLMLTVFQQLFR